MTMVLHGITKWRLVRDKDGYREYKVTHKVRSTDGSDGPYNAVRTPGLPTPGSTWSFFSDIDPYAYCKQDATVTPLVDDEKNLWYEVEQTFSNRGDQGRCKEDMIDNPLLQPQKISGSFQKFQEEATHDRFGQRVRTSSFEQIRGPQNEWDANRPQIRIEQNVAVLQLDLFSQMVDTVNMYTLWGLPPRTIKLSNVTWSANFYGSCLVYYTRILEFDIRYRRIYGVASSSSLSGTGILLFESTTGDYETWDRNLLDEGTKVLKGHWSPSTGRWVSERIGVLGVPGAPILGFDGSSGTLAAGSYDFALTAYNAYGESTLGDSANIVVPSPGHVQLVWDAVEGADGYYIYQRTGSNPFQRVVDIVGATTGVVIGSETPSDNPPSSNTASVYGDPANPSHFIRYQDKKGNPARVILNGAGLPAEAVVSLHTGSGTLDTTSVGNIFVQKYGESDMLLLGIPTVLG